MTICYPCKGDKMIVRSNLSKLKDLSLKKGLTFSVLSFLLIIK